jgi:hypothetical protein
MVVTAYGESRAFSDVADEHRQKRKNAIVRLLAESDVDWSEFLRQENQRFDRTVAAFTRPTQASAIAALKDLERDVRRHANRAADVVLAENAAALRKWNAKTKAQRLSELVLSPGCNRVWETTAELEARRLARESLALLALGLAGYRADHDGKYPAKLAELVPAYIEAIPKDPFTDGDLHYKSDGQGYLLYSVRPNGKDDGGLGPDGLTESTTDEQRRTCDDIAIRTPPKKAKGEK